MKTQSKIMHELFKDIEKIRKFNIYYLAFVSFIIAFGRVLNFESLSLGRHTETLLPIPVLLTIYLTIYKRGYKWPITYREKVIGAYLIFILLMPLWGLYLDRTLGTFRNFWPAVLFALLVMYNVRNEKDLSLLVFAFLSGAVLRGALSAWDFFARSGQPIEAFFRSPYTYGNFLLGPLALLYGLFLCYSKNLLQKIVIFTAFLLLLCVLIFTLGRATLIAFLFSLVFVSGSILKRKAVVIAVSLTIILLSFIVLSPDSMISNRFKPVGWKDDSLQYRIQKIWPAVFNVYANNNPIWGAGFGSLGRLMIKDPNYGPQLSETFNEGTHAHNHLLQALGTQGLIGVFIYLFYVYQISRLSWIIYTAKESGFIEGIGAGGLVWIISYTLTGLVHHEFLQSRFNMGFALMVTTILLSYYLAIQKESQKA